MKHCLDMNTFSLIYNQFSHQNYKLISDCKSHRKWYISNNSKIIEVGSNSKKTQDFWNETNNTSESGNHPDKCSNKSSCPTPPRNNSFPHHHNSDSIELTVFSDYYTNTDYFSNLNNNISQNTIYNENISEIIDNSELKEISDIDFGISDSQVIKYEINQTKEELINNFTEILNKIKIGKKYEFIGDDFIVVIRPTNSPYLENSTHINFTECENILRNASNISSSRILTFLQMEINNLNEKSLVNKVEYQVYDENKTLLNLSLCNNANINIFYLIKNNSLNIESYSNYKDLGIDILNINDSFFNDICYSFSFSKNDIILEDRIKDIYQNYSLCDEGCTYNEINTEYNTISCNCKIKTNITTNESSLYLQSLENIKLDSNFGIIKCYNLVFSLKGKSNNIGFWIFLILILVQIPFLFIYFYKGIKSINECVFGEMLECGYIKENNIGNKNIYNKNEVFFPPPKDTKYIKRKNTKLNENSSVVKLSQKQKILQVNFIKIEDNKEDNSFKKIENNNIKLEESNKIKKNHSKKRKIKKKYKLKDKSTISNSLILKDSKNIDSFPTQGLEKSKTNKEEINLKENGNYFNLININLKNHKKDVPKSSKCILNNYCFEEAIKYDLRSVLVIFYIFLLSKQAIFHAFLYRSPYEPFPLRLCLLIFIISSDLALNAIFYLDDKISEKYKYAKNLFLFTFNNNLTIILLSTLIGFIFMTLFTNLNNSIHKIRSIFKNEEQKLIKDKKYIITEQRKKEIYEEIVKILKFHKIKVIILVIVEIILMLFFWYYVTAFCHVYSKTQSSWLLDSFLSILSRFIIELLLSLGFAKLYRIGVESNIHCIYKIALFFYCFG